MVIALISILTTFLVLSLFALILDYVNEKGERNNE